METDTPEFWYRDPNDPCPWWFSPPAHYRGRITYYFDNRDDVDYPDVRPVLAMLADKFDAQIESTFSPYNSLFTVVVKGVTIDLVEDNVTTPYLSVVESEGVFIEGLINELKRALCATPYGNE